MNPFLEIEELLALGPECGSTRIITIDGRAGSGKTTLASDLHLHLSARKSVEVIHLDEIYNGWEDALGPQLSEVLDRAIDTLKKNEPLVLQIYNWILGEFDAERSIDPPAVLIIEGVGSGQRSIREAASVAIWMEIEPEAGMSRVLDRDGIDIAAEMLAWQIMEDEHFESEGTREEADFIFTTE